LISDLDGEGALDVRRVGAKAAALAHARRLGIPVLPGFVVESSASLHHMQLGARALESRGSGGARLAVAAEPVPDAARIEAAGAGLGDKLVARSSTTLESGGRWAGAFTSYLDLKPEQLPKAVAGCWAAAFSVDALGLQEAAGVVPGSIPMAVLVQPFLMPEVGGVAEISPDGVVVAAVAGPPTPLLQGWVRGSTARAGLSGPWHGDEVIELIGLETLDSIRHLLQRAQGELGANRCEWALTDRLWALQIGSAPSRAPVARGPAVATSPDLVPTAQAMVAAPGVLGTELVLPWALAGLPAPGDQREVAGERLLERAMDLSRGLTAQVWRLPADEALGEARRHLTRLSVDPSAGVDTIRRLDGPDRASASELMSLIEEMGRRLLERGVISDTGAVWHLDPSELERGLGGHSIPVPARVGVGRWEPLIAAVVLDHGSARHGTPAAGGIGAGPRFHVGELALVGKPPRRGVITAPHALPNLSQLVWDAAGLVTDAGSPAAHLFEAARSLGVPAVSGVDPGPDLAQIIAVDGDSGVVATLPSSPGE